MDRDVFTSTDNSVMNSVADGISRLVVAPDSSYTQSIADSFNDKLVFISRQEIFAAYCQKNVRTLKNFVHTYSGCGDGNDPVGIDPSCEKPLDNLEDYCEPQSCKDGATKLRDTECLENISEPACQLAFNNLKDCYAN